MMKALFTLLWFLASGLALAASPCDAIPGKLSHAPLKIESGVVCFVEEPLLDEKGEEYADAISVYLIPHGFKPIKAKGRVFMYDQNAGEIIDAFLLDINHDGKNEIVAIHSYQVSPSQAEPNSSGFAYSVYVYNQEKVGLNLNERATEWFGHSYSWFTNNKNKIYEYPYLTQKSVQKALSSPFISLMHKNKAIPVIVKQKSYLYEAPTVYGNPKKYLIAGDKATVDEYTAGWCRITYTGGKQPLQMWIMCDALEVDKKGKEQ